MANQKIEVGFVGKSLTLRMTNTKTGVVGSVEYYPVCNFVSLNGQAFIGFATRNPQTNQRRQRYSSDNMTKIFIETNGTHQLDIEFDLNDVENQPAWTPDAAGVEQAKLDINTWISTCSDASAAPPLPPGISTEAKQDLMIAELMKDSDFELACVQDINTGVHYIMRVYRLDTDGSIVIDYIDATGSVVVPPVPSDLRVCNPNAALSAILAEIQATNTALATTNAILQDIDDNTDDLESLATSSLTELQAINLNTDTLEALITDGNLDLAAIEAEILAQGTQLGTIITELISANTALGTINTSIGTADTNNVTELQNIQTQLTTALASLSAIDGNTAPLEASLTAIEAAINTGNLDLALIQTNTLNTVTELQTANATLTLLNGQFAGTPSIVRVDISGNAAYVVPAATYNSVQLIVAANTVSDGTITHPVGAFEETVPIKGATHPGVTFDATGATAYVKLMTN